MNTKSLAMLGLAVVFGLVAMLLSRQMLAKEPSKVEMDQDVLVAAHDLKDEEILKSDALKVIRMAKSAVPAGAYTTPKDVEERWVKTAMLEGDVVVEKKLGPNGTPPGLVANIPKGKRAFAIDVTEQSGVSGFILPGHRVDVIRYENERNTHRAEGILQDILVLASGQVFTRPEERSVATRTVTLALTPEQVDILVAARAKGQLSLALRGVNDHEVVTRPKPAEPEDARWKAHEEARQKLERELAELKVALAARPVAPAVAAAPARPPARRVHIYRGGRMSEHVDLDGVAGGRPAATIAENPTAGRPGRGAGAEADQIAEATAMLRRAGYAGQPLP